MCGSAATAADVTVYASDILSPSPSWTTTDGKVTLTDSAGNFQRGGTTTSSYGGSGTNAAYDNGDAATLSLTFSADSGLRQIGAIWTRASAVITGFVADPGLTVTGGTGATATYDAGAGSVTLSQPWNGGTVVLYQFANPGASAGQTLTFSYAQDIGGGAGYQFSLNRIIYQDAPAPPVITTGLPASTTVFLGTNATLSVVLDPGALPLPTYLWEHDPLPLDGSYIPVGTETTFTITNADPADAGNYRVTVTNSEDSAVSVGEVTVLADSDNDGLADIYETNTGTYVSPTDTGSSPTNPDTDGDGLPDGAEVLTHFTDPNEEDTDGDSLTDYDEILSYFTNPNQADTDGDGLTDDAEVFTHSTNPTLFDTDSDGLGDGAEIAGTDNSSVSHGFGPTDPLISDGDADGYQDGHEVANGSSPTNPESPGGPNPTAIAVQFDNQNGEVTGYGLSSIMYAGVPAVRQKNWNRANPDGYPATGSEANIVAPSAGVLVNSAGSSTTMKMTYSAVGAWADNNEDETTYGRLFGPFIYNDIANTAVNISLSDIPYATYDVYVYIGSSANGLTGTITSGATTYSYTSASGATTANGLSDYVETTSAGGFPQANYCVFRNVTGSNFAFSADHVSGNAGVFGFQVVEITTTAYQGWAISKGLDPLTDGAPSFDKDNDGSKNLAEYAFFTNPAVGSSLPVQTLATGGSDVTLTYLRAKAATDVTYLAEWSTNLVDWSSVGLTDTPTGIENTDTFEYRASVAKGVDPKKFLRVRVSLVPAP